MHPVQKAFCESIKEIYPKYFREPMIVLDVGSMDINGNNKYLFGSNVKYLGVDVKPGKNVDIVGIFHEIKFKSDFFDVVISTNSLEHDMYYKLTIERMVDIVKPGGLMLFSCAHKWREHGTFKRATNDSATTKMGEEWGAYYKNLNVEDIETLLPLNDIFSIFRLYTFEKDLRFYGIKE